MPRKPNHVHLPEAIDPDIDQEKLNAAMAQMRVDSQNDLVDLLDLAADIKAHQAFGLMGKFAAASQIAIFKRIRESNKIKDLPIRTPDGELQKCDSIREACPLLFGRSYDTMLREEEAYDLLGQEAYEIAGRLGISRTAVLNARTFPPAQLQLIRSSLTTGSTKTEVLTVIEDLATRLVETQEALENERADHQADKDLLTKKGAKIDALEKQARRVKAEPPDQVLAALQKETTTLMHEARACLIGGLRNGFIALTQHHETQMDNTDSRVFLAGIMGQLGADLRGLCDEFGIDPLQAGEAEPAWLAQHKD